MCLYDYMEYYLQYMYELCAVYTVYNGYHDIRIIHQEIPISVESHPQTSAGPGWWHHRDPAGGQGVPSRGTKSSWVISRCSMYGRYQSIYLFIMVYLIIVRLYMIDIWLYTKLL